VLMWHAVTSCEFDVVCGFDEEKHELYGRGSYASYADLEDYVTANELNPLASTETCGGPHVIIISDKTKELDARAAEIAALKEAVAHARGGSKGWLAAGLECYDLWIATYRKKSAFLTNLPSDSYPLDILPSTRQAAAEFMRELASKYPKAQAHLEMAAEHFARESEALKACQKVLADRKQELSDDQCIRAAGYLSQARATYALGIAEIERALRYIDGKQN
jgi:hypothetical protein